MYSMNYKSIDTNHVNIGSRGGATKISSGYAFSFFIRNLKSNSVNLKRNIHPFWENWMDLIFVKYIENNVQTEIIFRRMIKSLSGDEFASFMMGTSSLKTKLKIIYSMPKLGFLKSFFQSLTG